MTSSTKQLSSWSQTSSTYVAIPLVVSPAAASPAFIYLHTWAYVRHEWGHDVLYVSGCCCHSLSDGMEGVAVEERTQAFPVTFMAAVAVHLRAGNLSDVFTVLADRPFLLWLAWWAFAWWAGCGDNRCLRMSSVYVASILRDNNGNQH